MGYIVRLPARHTRAPPPHPNALHHRELITGPPTPSLGLPVGGRSGCARRARGGGLRATRLSPPHAGAASPGTGPQSAQGGCQAEGGQHAWPSKRGGCGPHAHTIHAGRGWDGAPDVGCKEGGGGEGRPPPPLPCCVEGGVAGREAGTFPSGSVGGRRAAGTVERRVCPCRAAPPPWTSRQVGGGGTGARAGTSAAAGRCGGTAWQPPPPAGRPPAGGIPHRGAAGETWRAAPALAHPGGPGGGRRGPRGPSPPPPSSPRSNGVWGVLCGLLMTMTLDDTPLTATGGCLSGAARHSPRETGRRSMGGAATHRPTTGHGWRGGRAGGGCCCSCQQLLGRGGAAV